MPNLPTHPPKPAGTIAIDIPGPGKPPKRLLASILIDEDNTANGTTTLTTSATTGPALAASGHVGLQGTSDGTKEDAIGVWGEGGDSGAGIFGHSIRYDGVVGGSDTAEGVSGWSAGGGAGVLGRSKTRGVEGIASHIGTGVRGLSAVESDPSEPGGQGGIGVWGEDYLDGTGLMGINRHAGSGVKGIAMSPTAVGVGATNTQGGVALDVAGRARFSQSGLLTIPAGADSAKQVAIGLVAGNLVLATIQSDAAGVSILAAVPDVADGSFTVHLSGQAPADVLVGWLIIG